MQQVKEKEKGDD